MEKTAKAAVMTSPGVDLEIKDYPLSPVGQGCYPGQNHLLYDLRIGCPHVDRTPGGTGPCYFGP